MQQQTAETAMLTGQNTAQHYEEAGSQKGEASAPSSRASATMHMHMMNSRILSKGSMLMRSFLRCGRRNVKHKDADFDGKLIRQHSLRRASICTFLENVPLYLQASRVCRPKERPIAWERAYPPTSWPHPQRASPRCNLPWRLS